MKKKANSFGSIVREARQKKGLRLKDCAPLIIKEDGKSISAQYLNDIELNQRNPPAENLLIQISEVLGIPIEVLYFYARMLPRNLTDDVSEERIVKAFTNFVNALS